LVLFAVAAVLVTGFTIGTAQWHVLRLRMRDSARWAWATAFGLGTALSGVVGVYLAGEQIAGAPGLVSSRSEMVQVVAGGLVAASIWSSPAYFSATRIFP
jgi:hypothetical protein